MGRSKEIFIEEEEYQYVQQYSLKDYSKIVRKTKPKKYKKLKKEDE